MWCLCYGRLKGPGKPSGHAGHGPGRLPSASPRLQSGGAGGGLPPSECPPKVTGWPLKGKSRSRGCLPVHRTVTATPTQACGGQRSHDRPTPLPRGAGQRGWALSQTALTGAEFSHPLKPCSSKTFHLYHKPLHRSKMRFAKRLSKTSPTLSSRRSHIHFQELHSKVHKRTARARMSSKGQRAARLLSFFCLQNQKAVTLASQTGAARRLFVSICYCGA